MQRVSATVESRQVVGYPFPVARQSTTPANGGGTKEVAP